MIHRCALPPPICFRRRITRKLSLTTFRRRFHSDACLAPSTTLAGYAQLHINRFGVIPKGHNTGKWRLITDLSHPQDFSVNDGIDPALCSLTYTSVDEIAETAAHLGPCALLAKVDIESAYRLIPVHPDDRPLQAVRWDNQIFVDPMLPFGLRSAPKIFNAVADWHLKRSGIPLLYHYLDDFIIVGPPSSTQCADSLAILDRECNRLRVPMASHKREGPTTCLIVLGIEIDTTAGHLRLPLDKLERLQLLLRQWVNKKACSRTELQSLIGLLNHAAKVVRSGRSFLRRMIDLLHAVPSSQMHIRLNAGFRADLAWWNTFLSAWNGISFLLPPSLLPAIEFTTDASGSWGCGAWCGEAWFQLQWDHRSHHLSIPEKELIPIILACASWGVAWRGCKVRCHCDNQVVVAALRSRTSKAKGVMHLLRCLVFIEAHHDCFIQPVYIDTKSNHLADDLSRNRLSSFLSKVPWFHQRIVIQRQCPTSCSIYSSTIKRTGHLRPGTVSSELFSTGSSPLHSEDVQIGNETLPLLLHYVQCPYSFSGN